MGTPDRDSRVTDVQVEHDREPRLAAPRGAISALAAGTRSRGITICG
jgi:hypothetical protein